LMPSQGGDVIPLTYGEYDNINPRWSPDGRAIVLISNRLHFLEIVVHTKIAEKSLDTKHPGTWGEAYFSAADHKGIRIQLTNPLDSRLHPTTDCFSSRCASPP